MTELNPAPERTPAMLSYQHPKCPKTLIHNQRLAYVLLSSSDHRMTQHPPRSPFSNVNKAALVAASNTSSTPSPVKDEHSRYFRAPISRAAVLPSLSVVKWSDFFLISSWASGSSRRSFLSPTRMIGTPGQRSLASSTHLGGN